MINLDEPVPLLDVLAVQKPQRPTKQFKTWSLVYRLFTDHPEDLQDSTRPCIEESPETVRPLASNRGVRQTHSETRPPRREASAD